jgi:hypothetical protein
MLSSQHFYHRITRKLVVAFGTIFNDLKLYRYNKAGTTEIERITVPLMYSQKEKFYQRITQDPELTKETAITLPRMSFEMTQISYDPLRKVSRFNQQFTANSNTSIKTVTSAPYNFDFILNIYVRNVEDGTQIIEQILPYFSPDYTVTIDLVGISDLKVEIPVVLQSINYNVSDTGGGNETRVLVWELNFTAKAYLYGPIGTGKIIRNVQANTYNNTWNDTGERKVTLTSGTGNYKVGELIFEGRTASAANSTGYVKSWDPVANNLIINDVSGILKVGSVLKGAVTNTAYTISSFGINDNQLTNLTVVPSPLSANIDTAFGFTETLEEYPNIT